jgi:hypothetical protein
MNFKLNNQSFKLVMVLLFFNFISCSPREDLNNDPILTNPIEYFSHVEDITYPEELESYAGYENPIFFHFLATIILST